MKRFKRILVAVDSENDNRAVIRQAVLLSRLNQARLCIVSVVEEPPYHLHKPTPALEALPVDKSAYEIIETLKPVTEPARHTTLPVADQSRPREDKGSMTASKPAITIQDYIADETLSHLEALVKSTAGDAVQVSCKVLYGTPYLEIIREVMRNGHDLVMITTKGQRAIGATLFGNTAMRLMRKCPCPVWVIKSTQLSSYHRILAAVDPAPHDEIRQALNHKIMELATSLARMEESELHIVHTWTVYGELTLKSGRGTVPQRQIEAWVSETRQAHRAWLIAFLQECALENLPYQVYQLKGEAGKLIPELVKQHKTDLIIMGTVCRTGIAGLLIGNTAEKVLRHVDCSILTVKPDGFVSPVSLNEE